MDFTTILNSPDETIEFGRRIGSQLKGGEVVAICGPLGSGKTHLIKGIAAGAGAKDHKHVNSPTFVIVNEYTGRCPLLHMDIYRLEEVSDFFSAGLDEYFYGNGVVVMEWADRWRSILPERRLEVKFEIVDDQTRSITFSGDHPRAIEILKNLESQSS